MLIIRMKVLKILQMQINSLQRTFSPDVDIILRGQRTDSGGGGTKEALARDISSQNIAHAQYLIGTCSLHNLQTGLRNAAESVLG